MKRIHIAAAALGIGMIAYGLSGKATPPALRSHTLIGAGNGESSIIRIADSEAGVVCYVMPKEHCMGDCAYSPAISCVRMEPR